MDMSLGRNNQKETQGDGGCWCPFPPMVMLTSCVFADYQRPPVAGDGGGVGAGGRHVALDVGIF